MKTLFSIVCGVTSSLVLAAAAVATMTVGVTPAAVVVAVVAAALWSMSATA